MLHLGTTTLETNRLILRKTIEADFECMFYNWANDERVTKFMTWEPYKTPEEVKGYISYQLEQQKKDKYYDWKIVLKEINEPIGSISVVNFRDDIEEATIGYCIGYKWWHQGITTEAFKAVIKFLFEEVGVNRIVATHDIRNIHSGNVMKKCGLQYEGTTRRSSINNFGIFDAAHYAILKEDYLK